MPKRETDAVGKPVDPAKHYYIQDASGYVGDFVSWWKADAHGYTCDPDKAGLYPGTVSLHRPTDVLWLPEDVAIGIERVVNIETINRRRRDPALNEGWAKPAQSKVAHYFREGRSLCGKWGLFMPVSDRVPPDETPCCAACSRRRAKEDRS